ncbi:hypothetical protein Nepgr_022988 [Nepenthes gracilis]|uniref:Uncharacterized protein n=1 Tax=Nepenthes gracilis TaxID=150966 RepID=A0AAD3T1X9_NEPGR|nr:hypothetical protein Nepgr_022988 [Nepenthes gracilis]
MASTVNCEPLSEVDVHPLVGTANLVLTQKPLPNPAIDSGNSNGLGADVAVALDGHVADDRANPRVQNLNSILVSLGPTPLLWPGRRRVGLGGLHRCLAGRLRGLMTWPKRLLDLESRVNDEFLWSECGKAFFEKSFEMFFYFLWRGLWDFMFFVGCSPFEDVVSDGLVRRDTVADASVGASVEVAQSLLVSVKPMLSIFDPDLVSYSEVMKCGFVDASAISYSLMPFALVGNVPAADGMVSLACLEEDRLELVDL